MVQFSFDSQRDHHSDQFQKAMALIRGLLPANPNKRDGAIRLLSRALRIVKQERVDLLELANALENEIETTKSDFVITTRYK